MRIPIAVQLGLLVLLTAVSGVAVLAIATWFTTYNFVVDVESNGLELVATTKASQIASNLDLLETTCKTIATRILIQSALKRYYMGNTSVENWTNSIADVQSALGSRGYLDLYQAIIYSKNGHGGIDGLVNQTSETVPDITLPYTYSNGTSVQLGNDGLGYPPSLYPNLTYHGGPGANDSATAYAFPDYVLGLDSAMLLGPLKVNNSFSLVSLTLPIVNNTSNTEILGFITIVASAANLQGVVSSRDGLGKTGQVLLIGPSRRSNIFTSSEQPATATSGARVAGLSEAQVHYIFEPTPLPTQASRHSGMSTDTPFVLSSYPMALQVMLQSYKNSGIAKSELSARNERGESVAVGAIRPQSTLVEWVLLVEETHAEAFAPVARLRKIILACVFGTAGAIILLVPLLTHWAVAPIRRLRAAAQKSVEPEITPHRHTPESQRIGFEAGDEHGDSVEQIVEHMNEKGSPATWAKRLRRPLGRFNSSTTIRNTPNHRGFQIPARVKERRHCVTDELTELTKTYNEMSDELTIQYNRLEERVAERTRELEKAKLAAETANESKTLFIANISHELKTPLNGILGMCAVCMGEEDLSRIKKSLQVVYQSGDLLLHLLNDLLTFSKNQIDQAIQIEEKEFKLSDVRAQLAIIFQNQVNEKHIDFSVNFVSSGVTEPKGSICRENGLERTHSGLGSTQSGRMADMVLWGDQHRILQVLINLVSNSLKFTPENGKVAVRIRLVDEPLRLDTHDLALKETLRRNSQIRSQTGSSVNSSIQGTADTTEGQTKGQRVSQSSLRQLNFQFEVQDNGPGIPPHLHRRIFDPFVQGDLGLNRKYGGTGLGLSICAQLSRIMGGDILLDSEEGKGSLFTLRIPLGYVKEVPPSTHASSIPGSRTPSVLSLEDFSLAARTPSNHGSVRNEPPAPGFEKSEIQPRLVGLSQPFFTPTVPSSPASAPSNLPSNKSSSDTKRIPSNLPSNKSSSDTKRIRVLVAEDNTVNQEVVRRMLALEEVYDVTIVKDGQEAYDTVKSNMEKGDVFDLIFMDIQMPILDGLESTRLIRQMGYSAPIVALSAFAEESNIKDCMDCGMDMFISKPIRRPALKQVLSKFSTIIEETEGS
ncbi:Six-hairpin glycosidase [Penicillium concentricum]|uniref:histidine kinase n=1 Tax=Penicillium concentricum TaxID=293559 RepID=A0A9W9SC38_9EURO|nr:Six-hairpin glycosidase [Penicillium concentricum]KAJ5374434.1 Six-hairpin glycosidase [Penicillium concentricum]